MSVLGTNMKNPINLLFTGSRTQTNSTYIELLPHSSVSPHDETPLISIVDLRHPIPKRQKFNLRCRVYLHGSGILT